MRSKGWKKTPRGYAKFFDGYLFEVRRMLSIPWRLMLGEEVIAHCTDLTHAGVCAKSHARKLTRRPQLRVIRGGKDDEP